MSVYGTNKLCGEGLIHSYAEEFGFTATFLRYANVYGPRQNPHGEAGVIAIFLDKLRAGGTPVINGTGEKVRDYVFVGDLVAANRFLTAREMGGTYNVGTGIGTTVNTLARDLLTALGMTVEIPHGPDKPGEQLVSVLDASRVRAAMGGFRFTPLAEGLARTIRA
jgi:UDP-glucose 4-epimerase